MSAKDDIIILLLLLLLCYMDDIIVLLNNLRISSTHVLVVVGKANLKLYYVKITMVAISSCMFLQSSTWLACVCSYLV